MDRFMKRALLLPLQKENEELRARLESTRAPLRELAAAATVYQDSVGSGLEARLKAGAGLSEVLRRAEAEAGDAK